MGVTGEQKVSETEANLSEQNNSGDEWSKVPSRPSYPDSPSTYSLGGLGEGMGTLNVREVKDESLEYDWTVVYEFIAEGESEPVSNILGEDGETQAPDVHSVDLPNNSFDSREAAENYATVIMEEQDIGELLEGYGIRTPETRQI